MHGLLGRESIMLGTETGIDSCQITDSKYISSHSFP